MEKLIGPGRMIYAIGLLGLGILCILSKDFIVGRPPAWPEWLDINPLLAYGSGLVLITGAAAILLKKKTILAALVIAALIFLLSVLRQIPDFMNGWLSTYKSLALIGGALIVAASFFEEDVSANSMLRVNEKWGNRLVLIGCLLLAVFFIACGYAHFKFAAFVIDFIPSYIPFRKFWTYFCGICLAAGGIGLVIPQTRTWAAFLMGLMILIWFLFLHIPRFFADTGNASDRMGLAESFTFVGILFVLTGINHRKTTSNITHKMES